MKAPKRKKAYVMGGEINPNYVALDEYGRPIQPTRTDYRTDVGAKVHDAGLSVADYVTGLGNPNAIKSSEYQTKFGATTENQTVRGGSNLSAKIGGAIVNYYVQGLGTAINAGRDAGINASGVNDPTSPYYDPGLNKKQSLDQDKAGVVIDAIGGSVAGMGKNKSSDSGNTDNTSGVAGLVTKGLSAYQKYKTNKDTMASVQVPNTDTQFALDQKNIPTEDIYGNKMAEGGQVPTKKVQFPVISNKDVIRISNDAKKYSDPNYKDTSESSDHEKEWNGLNNTDKQRVQNAYVSGQKKEYSEGGKVVGAGTGKSDSINASVEQGGFIVPAEHNAVAMLLRAKYLNDSPLKKAKV